MNKTRIQWTWNDALEPESGFTWNPVVGCRRVSTGCEHCYAERLVATRLSRHRVYEGLARMTKNGPQFTGEHRLIADRLDEPLRKRNPKGGRTFVCDLGDLFYEGHAFGEIAAVWGVMAAASHHTFQVLTKRPKRMVEWFAWIAGQGREIVAQIGQRPPSATSAEGSACLMLMGERVDLGDARAIEAHNRATWPLSNVWLGVSTENQAAANERIPWLLRCPAPTRFLSVEPQVDAIDLSAHFSEERPLHWVIQGGESGPGARPFDLAWMRDMRDQCEAAGVAFFPKQLGANAWSDSVVLSNGRLHKVGARRVDLRDSHGGEEAEWPSDLHGLRAFPRAEA